MEWKPLPSDHWDGWMIRPFQTSHDDKIYFSLAADQCAAICSSASLDVIEESKHHVGFLSDFFCLPERERWRLQKKKRFSRLLHVQPSSVHFGSVPKPHDFHPDQHILGANLWIGDDRRRMLAPMLRTAPLKAVAGYGNQPVLTKLAAVNFRWIAIMVYIA